MLSGPETTRILHQFEEQYLLNSEESTDRTNHEMGLSAQKTFKQQVNNLADVIKRMGTGILSLITSQSLSPWTAEIAWMTLLPSQ